MIFALLASFFLAVAPYQAQPGLDQRLREVIHPEKENQIGYMEINDRSGGINNGTWLYIHQAIESFKTSKPLFVILKLNTPGGESLPAMQICDALKELDTQYGIPVVAFIDNWAMSAGALIAYACRFITVVQDGGMGAAEPVLASQTGEMVTASEKIVSAFSATFGNQAAYFGRNPAIAEKMVDKNSILVKREGKVIKLTSDDQVLKTDAVISPKGQLLTLTAEQLFDLGVADILFSATKLENFSQAEKESGRWPLKKMLLGTYTFFAKIPNAEVQLYEMDFKSKFFALLMTPIVSSLLLLGVMLGLYLEFSTPGATLPGTVAVICLFLLGLSSFAFEIASWLEIILILAGIAILLIDIFFLPTFGLLGSFGVLLFVAGLLGLVVPGLEKVPFDPVSWEINGGEILTRIGWFFATLLLGIILVSFMAYWFPMRYNPLKRLVSEGEQVDYTAGGDQHESLEGKDGIVISTLRPAGKIEIDGVPYDAQSEGDFIEKGTSVRVQRVEGARLFVKRSLT